LFIGIPASAGIAARIANPVCDGLSPARERKRAQESDEQRSKSIPAQTAPFLVTIVPAYGRISEPRASLCGDAQTPVS
jgi:hypothetical protein